MSEVKDLAAQVNRLAVQLDNLFKAKPMLTPDDARTLLRSISMAKQLLLGQMSEDLQLIREVFPDQATQASGTTVKSFGIPEAHEALLFGETLGRMIRRLVERFSRESLPWYRRIFS